MRWRAMRLNQTQLAIIAGTALLLLIAGLLFIPRGNPDQDKLSDDAVTASGERKPEDRCAEQATYDLIKRDVFRRAADLRGRDQPAFDRISTSATARMERPLYKSGEDEVGLIRCTGRLSIDLPPGLEVVGGRRTLSANLTYVVQPAADKTGDVVMLEGADSIVIPLATLAVAGRGAPPAMVPATEPPETIDPLEPIDPPEEVEPPEPIRQQPAASPSFDCRSARSRGEIAVCASPSLAALDRQMATRYRQALGDPRNAVLLRRTRDAFLRFRDSCATDACIADAYRGRMREIDDIVSGNWRPGQ